GRNGDVAADTADDGGCRWRRATPGAAGDEPDRQRRVVGNRDGHRHPGFDGGADGGAGEDKDTATNGAAIADAGGADEHAGTERHAQAN
ncbi:MAG: hypothetical protein QOF33_2105, partial [Thermomicrobiales bacterium]|nr:hypothetical protein [Thermomicrobiales bacterium]